MYFFCKIKQFCIFFINLKWVLNACNAMYCWLYFKPSLSIKVIF
jgi:hypothetical protein